MSLVLSNNQTRLYFPGHKVANGLGLARQRSMATKTQSIEVINIDRFADISRLISSFQLQTP
jgi:hypothetical protein